jgi:hypothetical protein
MQAREHDGLEDVGLVRLTTWATTAAVALTVAALASLSSAGSERLTGALAALNSTPSRTLAQQQAEIENQRRSLNEALRLLASDRDRLTTRVGSLERNLDDITGSIKRQVAARSLPDVHSFRDMPTPDSRPATAAETPAKPPQLPDWMANAPQPWPSPSSGIEFAPGPPAWAPGARTSALPAQSATPGATVVSRTEFGVDIGSGADVEEVRALWNAAKAQHGRLFGKLRPVIVRNEDRAGHADYRLVIGPIANAATAARLCATLGAADVTCSTRAYQGERLPP